MVIPKGFRQAPDKSLTTQELRVRKAELKSTITAIVEKRLMEINAEQRRTGRKPSFCGLYPEQREVIIAMQAEMRAIDRQPRS